MIINFKALKGSWSYGRYLKVIAMGCLLIIGVFTVPGQSAEPVKSGLLFPVNITHPFPEAEKTFMEVQDLILDQYYSGEITREDLYWAAIKGMLRHISPPETPDLSTIWPAADYEKVLHSMKGEQISIGVKSTFNPADGSLTVTEVMPDSPADGIIQPMDRILRVNDGKLKGKALSEVSSILSGKEGEKIVLTINRDVKVFDVSIVCRKFSHRNLIATPLTEEITMVEIRQFTAGIADRLKSELEKARSAGVRALIIDLRNNLGGVFIDALKSVELFLPKNHILMRTRMRDTNVKNYVSVNTDPHVFSIAVLVNGKTASSAEILAAALRDHQKGILIGTRTFGKAIFEKTYTLENQMRVKFITGAMYTPKGISWHARGILPDFVVEQKDQTLSALLKMDPIERAGKDVAIITALKLLKR